MKKDKPKIYFDSCCFIEAAQCVAGIEQDKDRRSEAWFYRKLLEASKAGEINVLTSMLTVTECLYVKDDKRNHIENEEIQRLFRGLLTSGKGGVTLIQPELRIARRARDLRWKDGITLKPLDSIHLASALELSCLEFVTLDEKDFFKKREQIERLGIKVIKASNTSILPNHYRIETMEDIEGFTPADGGKEKAS